MPLSPLLALSPSVEEELHESRDPGFALCQFDQLKLLFYPLDMLTMSWQGEVPVQNKQAIGMSSFYDSLRV